MVTAKRARLTGMLMLVIMFTVGALAGAATMHVVEGDEAPQRERTAREQSPGLFDVLELTPEQQAEVDAVIERRRLQMDQFWREHRSTLRAISDSARMEIRSVLTPEQLEREERFRAERRRHHGREGSANQGEPRNDRR